MKDSPAFPGNSARPPKEVRGLTKREYFVGLAMQGLLAASFTGAEDVALSAIQYTDALIKELEKEPK